MRHRPAITLKWIVMVSVAELHNFYAAPVPGINFDAAPAPTLLYGKEKLLVGTKV
jgi:hypothetical protein